MSELCLHRGRARFTIDLHPSTAGDVLAGIREQLQQLLYKCAPPHSLSRLEGCRPSQRAQSGRHALWRICSTVLTAHAACRYSHDLKGIPLSYNSLTMNSVQVRVVHPPYVHSDYVNPRARNSMPLHC